MLEARFYTEVQVPKVKEPVPVSCSPDLVLPDSVVDYKVPSDQSGIPAFGDPWRNHVEQLQLNRYIINHAVKWDLPEGRDLPWDPRTLFFQRLYVVYLGPRDPRCWSACGVSSIPTRTGT